MLWDGSLFFNLTDYWCLNSDFYRTLDVASLMVTRLIETFIRSITVLPFTIVVSRFGAADE